MVNRHTYSLSGAAEATGLTRQGILAAIRRGTISAHKNAQGQWEINPAELHRVYPPVHPVRAADVVTPSVTPNVDSSVTSPVTPAIPPGDTVTNTPNLATLAELTALQQRLAVAEALLQAARDQAESALQERDAWKEQSHQWMVMSMKALPEGDVTPKRGFWARLFSSHGS